jgi:hypothetical protein
MATKAEIIEFLKQNFKTLEVTPAGARIRFTFDDGRMQNMILQIDDDHMLIGSFFASKSEHSAEEVLAAAEGNNYGVLPLNDYYILSNLLWTANVDANEIQDTLNDLAGAADVIEEKLNGKDRF